MISRPTDGFVLTLPCRFAHAVVLGTLMLVVCGRGMRAQENWSVAAAPTRDNLWCVAWGAGQFVAAGDNGTILASPNGVAWNACRSGTKNWIVAVSFANDRFVAVGDHGTLLTSADGFTWTSRPSGTTERLNAVGFGNDRWLAVGENGSAVTSADGVNWHAVPPSEFGWSRALSGWLRGFSFAYGTFVATGQRGRIVATADASFFYDRSVATNANLEGVAYGRHRFVAVGDNGLVLISPDAATWRGSFAPTPLRAVTFFNNRFVAAAANGSIFTSLEGDRWRAHPTGNTQVLTALATSPSAIVAVGFGGMILRATAAQAAPAVEVSPTDTTEAAGNNVRLTVTASGTAPLSYQWNFAGQPIAGATGDTLPLSNLTSAHAGQYTVAVSNSLGRVTSAAAALTVVAAFPAPTDIVDPAFAGWQLRWNDFPTALLPLPDGKILAAFGATVVRLQSDGSLDAAFARPAFDGVASIAILVRQPDGKILVGGTTTSRTAFLARIAADGALDTSFAAPSLNGVSVTSIALQPDGKIVVADNSPRLVRLNDDGSPDPGLKGADLSQFPDGAGIVAHIRLVSLAADGRIVVAAAPATVRSGEVFAGANVLIARFQSDGMLDPTLTPVRTGETVPQLLSVQADGRILLASENNFLIYNGGRWKVQRLNADGSDDPTFLAQTGTIAKYGGNMRAALDAAGRIVVAVALQNSALDTFSVRRFEADGSPDTTLRGGRHDGGSFDNLLAALVALPDGRMLVAGQNRFQRLVANNAVRLNPPMAFDDDTPPAMTVIGGNSATVTATAAGSGPLTRSWNVFYDDRTSQQPYAPDSDSLPLANVRTSATVYAKVTNAAGDVVLPPQRIVVPPSALVLTRPPADVAVPAGRIAEISFEALGSGPLHYQWFHNGREIRSGLSTPAAPGSPGADRGTLSIFELQAADLGTYRLVVGNPLGTAAADVTLSLDETSRLVDISTRGFVDPDASLVAGFVISDSDKWVLIRGVGPGLAPFGVTGFLADPKLTLYDGSGAAIDTNDNWVGTEESYSTRNWPATFALAPASRDAVIARRLPPGSYTVQLAGVGGSTGTALLEVYENIHETSRLANLSSRVFVGTDEHMAISGVVVGGGSRPKRVLIRAIGPALTRFGVDSPLVDPRLRLVDGSGNPVASNDDWSSNENRNDVAAAALEVGAFPLAEESKDAALLVTLAPGSYSALVTGVDLMSGVALVEIYDVP